MTDALGPQLIGETIWQELTDAADEDWAGRVGGDDPRFRDVLAASSGSFRELVEKALKDPESSQACGLAQSLPRIRARAEEIAAEPVDKALTRVLKSLGASNRNTQIVVARFGWGGHTARTLAEVGDNLGITRERVRQIAKRWSELLNGLYLPQVERAIQLLTEHAPISAEDAASLLLDKRLCTVPMHPAALETAAKLAGYEVTFQLDSAEVQIVRSSRQGTGETGHTGHARDDADLEAVRAAARQRLVAHGDELNLSVKRTVLARWGASGPLPITSSRMGHLWDALVHAYEELGFGYAAGGDEVFRQLVLARIIEPCSNLDCLRVLDEIGVGAPSYLTLLRRLPVYAQDSWRQQLAAACSAQASLGQAYPVFCNILPLHPRTYAVGKSREAGLAVEHRTAPQITIGLFTNPAGFPLSVSAFDGDHTETTTVLPAIEAFAKAHWRPDVTVVADTGMVSEAGRRAIRAAGWSFILGTRIPGVPDVVAQWRREHPGQEIPDGQVLTPIWPASQRRAQATYYQYHADRAWRTLRTRTVGQNLEVEARTVAGLKAYVTNLTRCPDGTPITADFVLGACRQLSELEKSFRISRNDLHAHTAYHHQRDSIQAHLAIVFAALATSRWIEDRTGWPIRKFVRNARRYRTIEILAGTRTIAASDPVPDDLCEILDRIHERVLQGACPAVTQLQATRSGQMIF